MEFIVHNIKMRVEEREEQLAPKVAKKLGIAPEDIAGLRVVRQSLDARKKSDILFQYTVVARVDATLAIAKAKKRGAQCYSEWKEQPLTPGSRDLKGRVVVVGLGPCGLFCGYLLALYGYRPLLIERGQDMEGRMNAFETLQSTGVLDPESNVCFGLGGAGAFSDGKLTTRIKDPRVNTVLGLLHEFGGPEEILTMAKPHMGTENIRKAVHNMAQKLQEMGAEIRYNTKLTDLCVADGQLTGAVLSSPDGQERVDTNALVLAVGHSARDTFAMLHQKGLLMERKPFAIGLRIEHEREFIDRSQLGEFAGHPRLGAAEYHLSAQQGDRGVYTFCMCPGGEVVCSATEPGHLAVNGMSYYRRDAQNSNSAVVVSVGTEDMPAHPLGGIALQQQYEKLCFALSGSMAAPAQRVGDFLHFQKTQNFGTIKPSYQPYVVPAELHQCLPDFVSDGIQKGLMAFDQKIRGFAQPDAVLTGIETRTSSPVRLVRDEAFASNICGIYPAGEGAGYAGGIVSAAVDGWKVARELITQFACPKYIE